VKPLEATDKELIAFIESQGYIVEGLLDGAYYSTVELDRESFDSSVAPYTGDNKFVKRDSL
jgi:hypothetical protein